MSSPLTNKLFSSGVITKYKTRIGSAKLSKNSIYKLIICLDYFTFCEQKSNLDRKSSIQEKSPGFKTINWFSSGWAWISLCLPNIVSSLLHATSRVWIPWRWNWKSLEMNILINPRALSFLLSHLSLFNALKRSISVPKIT